MNVLAGDIGGTKVHLALVEGASLRATKRYASREHGDLESICRDFVGGLGDPPIAAAGFGIAGPILSGRVQTTNLPWLIEQASLQQLLGCPVTLVNDLEASAHGIPSLKPEELLTLNEGHEVVGAARAIIAAGTGLGEGYMIYNHRRGRYEPRASEGGHADFGPRDAEQIALLQDLAARHGHVSVERVVSGVGIGAIFDHLAPTGRHETPATLLETAASGDPAPAISSAAIRGDCPIASDTMSIFLSAYGAEAGNLALKVMALGGLYVAGGIAPKILPLMTNGDFMEGFLDKGRFRSLMERIPVRVVLNERVALLGAAAVARSLASGSAPSQD